MDSLIAFIMDVASQPRYSYGWVLFGTLAVLPAIISGNALQHTLTKLFLREEYFKDVAGTLLFNFVGLIFFTAIIAIPIYRYMLMD